MRLQTFQCDICANTIEACIGLRFHGSWPGEFAEHDPVECHKHVCIACLKTLGWICELRKKASE